MNPGGMHPWWPDGIPVHPHLVFETLAYFVGWRLFTRWKGADVLPDPMTRATLLAVAVVGAALGAKVSCWFDDPAATWAGRADPATWIGGKSIVGALLGGVLAVEVGKLLLGVRVATGDRYVRPLWVGMAVGRVGCLLSGVTDGTHGLPTTLPWGMDHGDGVLRHPTALYEIAVLVALGLGIERVRWRREGDAFAAFLVGYLLWRVLAEALKPMPHPYLGLTGIQVASLLGAGGFALWVWVRARRAPDQGSGTNAPPAMPQTSIEAASSSVSEA